jgi:WD40 repeat protein
VLREVLKLVEVGFSFFKLISLNTMPSKHSTVRLESERRLEKISRAVDDEAIRSATELEIAYQLTVADEEKRKLEEEIKRITEIENLQRKEAASRSWKGAALLFRNAKAGEAVLKAGEASAAAALALEETRRANSNLSNQISITERLRSEIAALELDNRVTREALTTTKSALDEESSALEAAANEVLRLRDECARMSLALRVSSSEAITLGKLLVTREAENVRLNFELEWERKQRNLLDQRLGVRPRNLLHVLDIVASSGFFLEIEQCATLCKATWRLGGGIEAVSARSKYAGLKNLYLNPTRKDLNDNDTNDPNNDSNEDQLNDIQENQDGASTNAMLSAPLETIQAIAHLTEHVKEMEVKAVYQSGILDTDTVSNTLNTFHLPDTQPDTFSPVLFDRASQLLSSQTAEKTLVDLKPTLEVIDSFTTPLPSASTHIDSPISGSVQDNVQSCTKKVISLTRRDIRDAYFAQRSEPEWVRSTKLQAQTHRMPNFWSLAAHRTYGLWGRTRLMAAAHFGRIDRVELLLREHGAEVHPSQIATNNRTALVEAEANGHMSTAALLRAYGAHPFSMTKGEPFTDSPVKTISGKVLAIAPLPNGHIITGGEDGILSVWNAGDLTNSHWTCLKQLRGKHDLICVVEVISDHVHSISMKNLRVASGGSSASILTSASVIEGGPPGSVDAVKDEVTTPESAICLWTMSTGVCEVTLRGHKTRCTALVALQGGNWLASGGDNRTIRIWNISGASQSFGSCLMKLRGHLGAIQSLTYLPDGRLASSASDGTIRLWSLPPADESSSAAAVAYCSTILTVPSDDDSKTTSSQTSSLSSLVAGIQKNRIIATRNDGSICIWDIKSGLLLDQQFGHRGVSVSIALLPDGRLVSGGGDDDKSLRLWVISETGSLIAQTEWKTRCPCGVSAIAASSDGKVSTGFTDGNVTVWK